MTRLEWKMRRHRARVLDRQWRALWNKRRALWNKAGIVKRPAYPHVKRLRRVPPSSLLARWRVGLADERETRARAMRSLMRANLTPFRFW